jgi:hypothetical protein
MLLLQNTKKNIFKEKSKTTTALTCLIGAVLLFNQTAANALATSAGTMTVTTKVGSFCSVTATNLTFGVFLNDAGANPVESTGGGVVSTNCSIGTENILAITQADHTLGVYKMLTSGASSDTREINFTIRTASAGGGVLLSLASTFATATGIGSTDPVATLFGRIAAGQSGKVAGAYTKTMALSVTYN